MRLGFIFSQTVKGLKSNRILALSLTLVTFVSLMFLGAAALLQTQVGNMKNEWYDKVEVSAFMCPLYSSSAQCASGEATLEQIDAVAEFLESEEMAPYVAEVYRETKAEALANYVSEMEGTAWVDALTEEDMQMSFRVKLVDPEQYQIVADELSGRPGVEVVRDQRAEVEPIFNVFNGATLIAAGLAGTMIVTALLLISTMIRLSALFRAKDTSIMRMVGASNSLIQTPFILEGVFAAFVGSVLASLTLWGGVKYLFEGEGAERQFAFINLIDTGDVLAIAPWLILGSVLLTALASFIALRRYTRI